MRAWGTLRLPCYPQNLSELLEKTFLALQWQWFLTFPQRQPQRQERPYLTYPGGPVCPSLDSVLELNPAVLSLAYPHPSPQKLQR